MLLSIHGISPGASHMLRREIIVACLLFVMGTDLCLAGVVRRTV